MIGHIPLSLDGLVQLARAESTTWAGPSGTPGPPRACAQLLMVTSTATTALLDGRTYQGFWASWPAVACDEDADPRDRLFAWWLNEAEKIVVSAMLTAALVAEHRVADDDPAELAQAGLRKEDGGDIVALASHDVNRRLLEAGEVDRLSITVRRELIGAGARSSGDGLVGSSWSWPRPCDAAVGRSACVTTWSGRRPVR